jgi:hypothetical protein
MSDPKFIRNKDPHQVSMPEGSRVAASKTADAGGPAVRNTLVDEEEIISNEGDPLLNLGFQLPEVVKNYAELNLTNKDIGLEAKKLETSENLNSDVQPSFSAEYIEAEMNFLARLIHLKIENDKVKNEMADLENLMSNGI